MMRHLAICAILATGAANVSAQYVTATSGDPLGIAAIQATLSAIDADTGRYRRTEHTLLEYSAEGGTLVGYYDGASLRKLSAHRTGESGRLTQHLYYSAAAGRLIRRIHTQSEARATEEISSRDALPELLSRVKAFVACAAASVATCTAAGSAERYTSASVGLDGLLRIVTLGGDTITVPRARDELGFDQIMVSPDSQSVGWVGLRKNCCTSYPIPTRLFIHRAGTTREFEGADLPVWNWMFSADGKRVAFHQETVHGGLGVHYELHDVTSGDLVAEFTPDIDRVTQRPLPDQPGPAWARALDAARRPR